MDGEEICAIDVWVYFPVWAMFRALILCYANVI